MKRILALAAMGAALTVAGCEQPRQDDAGLEPMPPMETVPPPAEPVPAPAESSPATPPTDTTALPDDKRSSEETVRPESETLFY